MKRSHKKTDPAYLALRQCVAALCKCPPRMRRATLAFLLDRFVVNAAAEGKEGEAT